MRTDDNNMDEATDLLFGLNLLTGVDMMMVFFCLICNLTVLFESVAFINPKGTNSLLV